MGQGRFIGVDLVNGDGGGVRTRLAQMPRGRIWKVRRVLILDKPEQREGLARRVRLRRENAEQQAHQDWQLNLRRIQRGPMHIPKK